MPLSDHLIIKQDYKESLSENTNSVSAPNVSARVSGCLVNKADTKQQQQVSLISARISDVVNCKQAKTTTVSACIQNECLSRSESLISGLWERSFSLSKFRNLNVERALKNKINEYLKMTQGEVVCYQNFFFSSPPPSK